MCPIVMRHALLRWPALAILCTLAGPLAAHPQGPAGAPSGIAPPAASREFPAAEPQAPSSTPAPFPGAVTSYLGFDRHDFEVEGERFTVAVPRTPAPGRPWLWVAEFFGNAFWHPLDAELLARGWHIAYNASAAGQYGSPRGVARWGVAYDVWTRRFGLDAQPVLAGYSRGGLLVYNWAAANPGKVRALYADAPVCRIQSWPGGTGRGKGSPRDWRACLDAYGLTDEEGRAYAHNPVDQLGAIARAGIPVLHVVGDADDVVPVEENTAILAARFEALGGRINVIHKPGIGHHPHALPDPAPIVAFILGSSPGR